VSRPLFAAGDTHADEMGCLRRQLLLAPARVLVERVATVDDDVSCLEQARERPRERNHRSAGTIIISSATRSLEAGDELFERVARHERRACDGARHHVFFFVPDCERKTMVGRGSTPGFSPSRQADHSELLQRHHSLPSAAPLSARTRFM
jgi:hypothetical protein